MAILERVAPKGKILGIEQDQEVVKNLEARINKSEFRNRIIIVCDNFANLKEIAKSNKFKNISGILFDLGMSSWHLESSGRGFTFLKNEPLDMRYSIKNRLTAEKIINYWSESDIEKILNEYGQEQFAKEISKRIIETRKIKQIKTTGQLVKIIKDATPGWYQRKKINPATKTFQALRVAVNDELGKLQGVLPQALEILNKEGRLAIISFHSLEDKIAKNFLRENSKKGHLRILTKKPVGPEGEEMRFNPRSRSAKLRVGMKKV